MISFEKQVKNFLANQTKNAQTSIDGSNYLGTWTADMLLTFAYIGNDFVSKDLVKYIDGIKKKMTMYIANKVVRIGDRTALFNTSAGESQTLLPVELTPIVMSVNEEFDYLNLRQTYFSQLQSQGVMGDAVPPELLRSVMYELLTSKIAITHGFLFGRGKARTPNAVMTPGYLGFEDILKASGVSKKIALPSLAVSAIALTGTNSTLRVTVGSTANLSVGDTVTFEGIVDGGSSNVGARLNTAIYNLPLANCDVDAENIYITNIVSLTQFDINVVYTADNTVTPNIPAIVVTGATFTNALIKYVNITNATATLIKVWQSVPLALREKEGFNIMVHPNIAQAYLAEQSARLGGLYITGQTDKSREQALDMLSFKIVSNNSLSPNTIIGAERDNLLIGVDDVADSSNVNEIDMAQTTGDLVYRTRVDFASVVQVAKPKETIIAF